MSWKGRSCIGGSELDLDCCLYQCESVFDDSMMYEFFFTLV